MALENEKLVEIEVGESENPNRAERVDDRHPRDRAAGREGAKSLRALVKGAIKEVDAATKPEEPRGRRAAEAPTDKLNSAASDRGQKVASPDAGKEIPETPKPGETAPNAAPQAPQTIAAPAALSKEVKAIWDTLPAPVQAEFARREADTQKGVDQIKARYKPLEDAFAPFQGQLRQLGKTEAQAAEQLLAWQAALAGPNKVHSARALLQAHGINLTDLVPQGSQAQTPNQQSDPSQILRPYLDPLQQKITSLETDLQRRDRERVDGDLQNFAQDKPHFDKVRELMGILIRDGKVTGNNQREVLNNAYKAACRVDEEVFTSIQNEENAQREAELKAKQEADATKAAEAAEAERKRRNEEVAKARKAGVGPRAGSPTGFAQAPRNGAVPVGQSIRDTVKELSARA